MNHRHHRRLTLAGLFLAPLTGLHAAVRTDGPPVLVGLDGEFSVKGSTSAQSIELGARVAIEEVNAAGGVLGGRPLALVTRDNRANPARAIANVTEMAAMPDLVAVLGGRFSPVMMELVKPAHDLQLPLLAAWSSATGIVQNGHSPNYVFRLALHDPIAIPALIDRARAQGRTRLGMMVANTTWGRSAREAAGRHLATLGKVRLVDTELHNVGDQDLLSGYLRLVNAGAQAIVMVAGDTEASGFVRALAALEPAQRVPLVAHWGITGGEFHLMTGTAALAKVNLSVIQTFSLFRAPRQKVERVMAVARRLGHPGRPEDVPSPVGFGHAYDLVHILARAVRMAGGTDRAKVRDALETVRNYDGLVRRFERPFTAERHEALGPGDIFFARYRPDGTLVPADAAR